MKRADMLKTINYTTILDVMMNDDQINQVKQDVEVFMKRDHKLSTSVLNAILIRTITLTGGNFNEAYLRKVAETFKDYKILTAEQAVEYLENNNDNRKYFEKDAKQDVKKPDWLDGNFIKDLTNMEG